MRARSRPLRLAGATLTTPLLIPSVSSRGFPLDPAGIAESSLYLQYALDGLDEALLVSAYDVEHRTLKDVTRLLDDTASGTVFDRPRLLVLDSGGYETGLAWESGHIQRDDPARRLYDAAAFARIVDRLPPQRPTLVVSYDGPDLAGDTYGEQIRRAQAFFATRTHVASDILLKPTERWHSPRELAPYAPDLVAFDVVGFTEKELGDSYLARLCTLARLRIVLDEAGVDAPIHLFGALDPLLTPLYFSAGAEIFDGLSWMRYAYIGGLAVHPDAGALLRGEDDDRQQLRDAKRPIVNLGHLRALKRQMERYAATGGRGFDEFAEHGAVLARTHATMLARIEKGID
ncbi:hypothetical protein C8E95_5570 [Pseudonocardia autotrophica]|uniref:Uncharacterized protein n=2 Tax=Pseudonocardia TaxID=1847 RepID=A0A1Y2MIV4_PSEAH|nr:hypothetical protein BG845_06904 [Pseudonocardia autotrophica]TDN76375.1 hypothetical protein C8E95_5570 [Pseudonocardia autotrophica]BBG00362.1 hypothetical protein Pdca_15710 [Pseudonocardia autotrophica]GEC29790.1 hypothetical protein PSA01_68190 [Pseudonocardia saturnea]